jgi:hypothetical protein
LCHKSKRNLGKFKEVFLIYLHIRQNPWECQSVDMREGRKALMSRVALVLQLVVAAKD